MIQTKSFRIALFIFVCLFAFHIFALTYYYYFRIWWLDIPMHFFGGVTVALFALSFCIFRSKELGVISKRKLLACLLISVFVFGVVWEIYEYVAGVTFLTGTKYIFDTTKDLILDTLGGFAVWLFFIKKFDTNLKP